MRLAALANRLLIDVSKRHQQLFRCRECQFG